MALRDLVPDSSTINAPLAPIIGDDASGLIGLANRLASQDLASSAGSLAELFQRELAAVLPAQGAEPFSGAVEGFDALSRLPAAPPTDLLSGLERPLADVDRVLRRVPELVDTIAGVARDIEAARSGDLTPLIQRAAEGLTRAVQAATGPDFTGFDEWRRYLGEVAEALRPAIAAGGSPDEVRDRLLVLALARVRDIILGLAPELNALRAEAAGVLDGLLPDVPGLGLNGLRDDGVAALGTLRATAEAGGADIAARIDEYRIALRAVTDRLHNALDAVEARLDHPLLTPGGLSAVASRELDRIRALTVDDYSNVEARVEAFFTRIEEAVDRIDLSAVSGGIAGFFDRIEAAIGGLDPARIEAEVDGLLAEMESLVARLEELLTALTSRIQGWLTEVGDQFEAGLGALGESGPDGRFHFRFEAELDGLYARMDAFVQGDPARPQAFSVRGTLQGFHDSFQQLLGEAEAALAEMAARLLAARDEVAAALEGVRAQIEAVDPRAVMEEANAALEGAFQQIGELDFNVVVDPVIAELDAMREELASIDVSDLNDALKSALAAALDVVLSFDFEGEVTDALLEELDELLEEPRRVLRAVGDRVRAFVDQVTRLSPESLLEPVQAQLDRITEALDVDLRPLLRPLVDGYQRLTDEVRRLDPTQFLAPLGEAFGRLRAAASALEPQALLAPLQQEIDRLGAAVQALDLRAPLTGVNAVLGEADRFLAAIDPAALLAPLHEPFAVVDRALETIRPSVLLAPVVDIMDQIRGFTAEISDAVIGQIRGVYDEALARADSLDPTAVFTEIGGLTTAFRARLDALQPAALLHALQQAFTPALATVTAADARTGATLALQLDPLAPTLAFGAVIGRYERVAARVAGVLDALDPAALRAGYAEARAKLDELLPLAIRDDITPGRLRALLGLMDPATWITRLDVLYQRLRDKFAQLDPTVLLAPLVTVHGRLRAALAAIDVGRIVGKIEAVVDRVGGLIRSLSLESILAPVLRLIERLRAVVNGLDPAPLIAALHARFQALIDVFEEFGPEALIESLAAAWSRLADQIGELFDLETIAAPVLEIFDALRGLLGGLDAGPLIGTVEAKLDALRAQLEEALDRTGAAFRAMIAAAPVRGGAGASVAVGTA